MMKIPFKLIMLAGAASIGSMAFAQDKFDAMSNLVLDTYHRVVENPSLNISVLKELPVDITSINSRAGVEASFIVTLNDGYTADDVAAYGFEVVSVLDEIVVARGAMDEISAFADTDMVKAITFGNLRKPLMDNTRLVTGAQDVQDGTGLPQKYDGTGVITGIWDTGMQPNHVNFLNSKGESRIGRFWFLSGQGGSATEYTSANISKFTTDDKEESHGTHTMGCLAGSYNGRGGGGVALSNGWSVSTKNPYYGMAPGAEIAAAAGDLYDPNTIAAVGKIADYATSVNKPFVLNLSIGSNAGPHDGTDAVGQALNKVAQRGGIVFVSAGNEGEENISIVKNFSGSDTSFSTFVECSSDQLSQIQFWSNTSETFTLTLLVYNRQTNSVEFSYDFLPTANNKYRLGYGGTANMAFSSAFVGSSSYVSLSNSTNSGTNNRYSIAATINLTLNTANNPKGANYAVGFKVTGKSGQRVDVSSAGANGYPSAKFTSYNVNGYTNGSPDFSINDLACGPNVISVGSWNARITWPVYDMKNKKSGNATLSAYGLQGSISAFSSFGTLIDGRKLPEICTPGMCIVSSISTYNFDASPSSFQTYISGAQSTPQSYAINPGQMNYWYYECGTSMASPVAAGGVALWLQANPYLKVSDVKKVIKETAITTDLPAATPMARWGGGKLDVLAGMKAVLSSGVKDVTVDNDDVFFTPNGDNSWDVFVAGAKNVNVDVYTLAGVKVASDSERGDKLTFSADNLAKGIYVVTINGANAQRIAIK